MSGWTTLMTGEQKMMLEKLKEEALSFGFELKNKPPAAEDEK